MISKENIGDFFNRYASTMNNALFGEVYDKEGSTKIFAYVTGDEQAAFKAHKLLPENLAYGAEH